MHAIEVSRLCKSFNAVKAVDDLSFNIEAGEIFGLLGPNGAGKTTTIRLILDILKPDSGEIIVLGGQMNDNLKNHIGYMPEERGLYQDISLERVLLYLASLKGRSPKSTLPTMMDYLERFELLDYRKKKVKELSRGMQQKAQVIATLLHQPELIIVDEPFSGLDPINTQLVKSVLLEMKERGSTIILSTHQLNQVQEICERILLLDNGKEVLYGNLDEIRYSYYGHSVIIRTHDQIPNIPGIRSIEPINGEYQINLEENTTPEDVLKRLVNMDVKLESFQFAVPTFDEIFIRAVQGNKKNS